MWMSTSTFLFQLDDHRYVTFSLHDSFTSSVRSFIFGWKIGDNLLTKIRAIPSSPLPVWSCVGHLAKHGTRGQNFRRPPLNGCWISLKIHLPSGSWIGNSLCDENYTISSIMQWGPFYCVAFVQSHIPQSHCYCSNVVYFKNVEQQEPDCAND